MPTVEVPGMGDVEFPDDMSDDQIAAAIKANMPAKQAPATASDRAQALSAGGYSSIAGSLGLPVDTLLNVWDLGKAGLGTAQGLVTGKPPSEVFDPSNRADYVGSTEYIKDKMAGGGMNPRPARPDDTASQLLSTGANLAGSMFLGRALPAPPAAQPTSTSLRTAAFKKASDAGYVVPPPMSNPTLLNKLLGSIGGKAATEIEASIKNADVTDDLAKQAIGLKPDDVLTTGVLKQVMSEAAKAYKPIRNVGMMRADSQYDNALDAISQQYKQASKSFPQLARGDIDDAVNAVRVKSFDSESALDAIALLRDKGRMAGRAGDNRLADAYGKISKAVESAIERSLSRRGNDGQALLGAFRDARQLIAKAHTIDDVLNPVTGNVNAQKLAGKLGNEPLSGELKQIAEFATGFPKAARTVLDSGSTSNVDIGLSALASGVSKNPSWLTYPFSRQAARDFMLSKTGQGLLGAPSSPRSIDPRSALGLLMYGRDSLSQ